MGSPGEDSDLWGVLAIIGATFFYGSYFVPVKKYEIHDGIVYQWYQCSGIMLAGMACALARNDWALPQGTSTSGFCVSPEGVMSGLLFQVANFAGTLSVKSFGLGNFYTVHQVTNLGIAFVVGIFGPDFGLPAKPPRHVALAGLGFIFVLLGMLPVMFMEKEKAPPRPQAACQAEGAPELGEASSPCPPSLQSGEDPNRLDRLFVPDAPEQASALAQVNDPGRVRMRLESESSQASAAGSPQTNGAHPRSPGGAGLGAAASSTSQRQLQARVDRAIPSPAGSRHYRGYNARTWDGTLSRPCLAEAMEEAAEPLQPLSFLGSIGLVVQAPPESPEAGDDGAFEPSEQLLERERASVPALGPWLWGFFLSLLSGAFYASMYTPTLAWKERMRKAGIHVNGNDSFFSMCIGLYLASTAYLLSGGAWKKYKGERMEKSVMRPALLSGVIYAVAAQCFLYAMMVLPYAVGYALGVGGGLTVSLLWSTLVFGEASSRYNRRCVVCSFAGVAFGVTLLAVAA